MNGHKNTPPENPNEGSNLYAMFKADC